MQRLRGLLPVFIMSALLAGCDTATPPSAWHETATLGIYSASISEDGRYTLIGAQEEGGSLWDITSHARVFDWNHRSGERSIIAQSGFSPDGRYAVTANQQDLVLWQTATGQAEGFWSSPGEILDLALAPDANYALLGLANHEAVYFDIKNGGVKQTLRHTGRVRSVALSADSSLALTGSDDYKTTLWDMRTGEKLQQITLNNIIDAVALAPQGNLAFSASSLDQAILWDPKTGNIRFTLSSTEGFFPKRVSYVAARFSSNGEQLLTGTASGLIQLWNTQTGTEIKQWRAHKKEAYGPTSTSIESVGFGAGKYYAIGSNGIINVLQ